MPIRTELRHFYKTPEYRAARERVIERAKNRCEQCGVPNRVVVVRGPAGAWRMRFRFSRWHTCLGSIVGEIDGRLRSVKIVCTVAHLDHTPGHDDDANLKFLCQWCHLNYDKLHHKETRIARKDASRPLLREAV